MNGISDCDIPTIFISKVNTIRDYRKSSFKQLMNETADRRADVLRQNRLQIMYFGFGLVAVGNDGRPYKQLRHQFVRALCPNSGVL